MADTKEDELVFDSEPNAEARNDSSTDTIEITQKVELDESPITPEPSASNEPTNSVFTSSASPAADTQPSQPVASTPAPSAAPNPPHVNTAGTVVLQWLTYAFWGWLIIGLIWLISVILINAILKESVSTVVPYAIAASIVLLPIAFVTDLFYRKHEPLKKTGAAMVIMVIHAVIFALFGIGALIIAVFVGLNAAINAGDNIDAQMVGVATAASAAVLYTAAFLRTLNPFKSAKPLKIFSFGMLGASLILLVLAIVGPVVQSIAGRNDTLIEQNLTSVQRAVNDYIDENEALPTSLNEVSLSEDGAQELVTKNLVEYIPGTPKNTVNKNTGSVTTEYRYELCVTYTNASKNSGYDYPTREDDGYSSYLYVYSHGAGRECYKLKGTVYDFDGSSLYDTDTRSNEESDSTLN